MGKMPIARLLPIAATTLILKKPRPSVKAKNLLV
jgi:hypothetical protein